MIFPLEHRSLIRGCAAHIRAGLGCGADYEAAYVPLYAPIAGTVEKLYYGAQGGNWLWLSGDDGYSYQFAHLSQYAVKAGQRVDAGERIAVTGNTGNLTTGPHLHVQILKGLKRYDPEMIFAGAVLPGTPPPVPPTPPIGDTMTEKQWVDLAVPSAILYWDHYHPGKDPDVTSIINDLRAVYRGGDAGELYRNWMKGL